MKINCVRFLLVVLLGLFTLPALPAHAQENHAQPLITQPIDAAKLVTLRGNTHPMAIAKYDRGLAPASLPMG
ncbi:MAG: hypothetical protein WA737_02430, partial [Candidatus Acidiferrales bacterium]